jgi:hypothetical protein
MPSPRYWREIPNRFRLEAARCRGCGKLAFPPRRVCPSCRKQDWAPVKLSWEGKVVTSTVVQVAPTEFQMEAPFAMAVIETPEGARLMAQVVDCDPQSVLPGMKVDLVFRLVRKEGRGGILCYGFKSVPAA